MLGFFFNGDPSLGETVKHYRFNETFINFFIFYYYLYELYIYIFSQTKLIFSVIFSGNCIIYFVFVLHVLIDKKVLYIPDQTLSVNEQMIRTKERTGFLKYMPKKLKIIVWHKKCRYNVNSSEATTFTLSLLWEKWKTRWSCTARWTCYYWSTEILLE